MSLDPSSFKNHRGYVEGATYLNFKIELKEQVLKDLNEVGDIDLVCQRHNVPWIGDQSEAVAFYTYEFCTEEFISTLPHIIKSSLAVTEARVGLQRWMARKTKDTRYLERAKNLIIDKQIKIVQDELNDNRVYVDSARFIEWMEDEIIQDLTP